MNLILFEVKLVYLRTLLRMNEIIFFGLFVTNLMIFMSFIEDHIDTTDETQITATKTFLEKSSTTTNTSSECTSYASSSSVSNQGPSSSQNEFQSIAGTSRMEYGLTTFLDYNEQRNCNCIHLVIFSIFFLNFMTEIISFYLV